MPQLDRAPLMTIAACYLTSEGVVFGADSTTTMMVNSTEHHLNHAQKIFEVGEASRIGITMWGLGNLPNVSYRTLLAIFGDELSRERAPSMHDVALRWSRFFWDEYTTRWAPVIAEARRLRDLPTPTDDERQMLVALVSSLSGGFCIGGICLPSRQPQAFEFTYSPILPLQQPRSLALGETRFWGVPNIITRLIFGIDMDVVSRIEGSHLWTGSTQDLVNLIGPSVLVQPRDAPLREAIDWVHASIYLTIKAMKFSHLAPVCGGAVEVAIVTSDRPFRWVRHKNLGAAIGDGVGHEV